MANKLTEVRVFERCNVYRSWEWSEKWGPNLTDETIWKISQTDQGPVHLHHGQETITMPREVLTRVAEIFAGILDGEQSPDATRAGA